MTTDIDKVNGKQHGPFELDLTGEMSGEFKRSVQINMPRAGGFRQFNIDCYYGYGTSDDISRTGDSRTLMMEKLKRWSPEPTVLIRNAESGQDEPRKLSCKPDHGENPEDEEVKARLEQNKRLLLSIPWLREPISTEWFRAMLGQSADAGKQGNS